MSYVVDYKRLKRIDVSEPTEKFNVNHMIMVFVAIFIMYIYKRVKDKKSLNNTK